MGLSFTQSATRTEIMYTFFRKGHDAGDHPPITPMRSASESELGHEMWRIYDYITRHFIATVSQEMCTHGLLFRFNGIVTSQIKFYIRLEV